MEHTALPFLKEIMVFLGVTALVIPLFNRIKINPVLGFLIMGIVLGPFGIIHLTDEWPFLEHLTLDHVKNIHLIGELGVVFLLFSIGLELSSSRLWAMRKMVFGLGSLQVILSGLFIAFVATLWGHDPQSSVLIGSALALSSTAVIVKLLVDQHKLASPLGQKGFSILLMQDLAIVPILFLVTLLAAEPTTSPLTGLMVSLGKAVAAVVIIFFLGRYILRPLFHYVSVIKSRDMFMATILFVVLTTGLLGYMAGMSMAVGAFLAGVMLAETEYSHQIEIEIEPFRGLFLGLFFLSVGMRLDISILQSSLGWITLSIIGLILVKTLIITFCCFLFRISLRQGLLVGLMLGGAGEFAFVILEPSIAQGLIPPHTGQFMMILATATIFLTPLMFELVQILAKYMGSAGKTSYSMALAQKDALSDHIIFAGFGRVGQTIADFTGINQLDYIALDMDGELCQAMKQQGYRVYFGDISHENVLRKVNADRAKTIVLTIDDEKATRNAVKAVLKYNPDITLIARAKNRKQANELKKMGVNHVILETLEMSLQMGSQLLSTLGMSHDTILGMTERERQKYKLEETPS